jgi:hypothetical protein
MNFLYIMRSNIIPELKITSYTYNEFFNQVLCWIENEKKLDIKQDLFKIKWFEKSESVNFENYNYKYHLLFFSEIGRNSTCNSIESFNKMPTIFINFLKDNGYTVLKTKNFSESYRIVFVYKASKKGKIFQFIFESEISGKSGYSKIVILD